MPSRKGRADISPEIRGGLKRYFAIQQEKGRPVSDIWHDLFESDPMNAMRLAISLLPREMDITTTELSPEQWLEAMADASKREGDEAAEGIPGPVH